MCKDLDDKKAWFFTTWGAVSHLRNFEELDALITEEEVAFGSLRQPCNECDVFDVKNKYRNSWT